MTHYFFWLGDKYFAAYTETKEGATEQALAYFTAVLTDLVHGVEVKARTERCDICQHTYPPSAIVKRTGEQLCHSCDADKYPIRDQDIPF